MVNLLVFIHKYLSKRKNKNHWIILMSNQISKTVGNNLKICATIETILLVFKVRFFT